MEEPEKAQATPNPADVSGQTVVSPSSDTSSNSDEKVNKLKEELKKYKGLYEGVRSDLNDKNDIIKKHNSEMVTKKQREEEAKNNYEAALKLHEEQVKIWESEKAELLKQQHDYELLKKTTALKFKLMDPTKINQSVPIDDVIKLINVDKVEFDENGEIANFEDIYTNLIKGREKYLKPNGVAVGAGTGRVGEGGRTNITNEAYIVRSHNPNMSLEAIQRGLENPTIKAGYERRGWLKPRPDYAGYRSGD